MPPQDDARAVIAHAEERSRALAARDAAALARLMHPASRWTTHRGHVLERDAYIAGNTESGALRWHGQRLEAPDVVVVGDTAVLVALVVDDVERDGRRVAVRLRLTQTWVRAGAGWRCLAGHAGPEVP